MKKKCGEFNEHEAWSSFQAAYAKYLNFSFHQIFTGQDIYFAVGRKLFIQIFPIGIYIFESRY